jgi:hypothetical protein
MYVDEDIDTGGTFLSVHRMEDKDCQSAVGFEQ